MHFSYKKDATFVVVLFRFLNYWVVGLQVGLLSFYIFLYFFKLLRILIFIIGKTAAEQPNGLLARIGVFALLQTPLPLVPSPHPGTPCFQGGLQAKVSPPPLDASDTSRSSEKPPSPSPVYL